MDETKFFFERKICKCKKDCTLYGYYDDKLQFYKMREYKVEVFPTFYNVYMVNDFYHYVSLTDDDFNAYFEMVI